MNEEGWPCPHCIPPYLTPEKIVDLVAEIKIDPSLAADDKLYGNRLSICGECEALREEVLCSHCGCFILFRARAVKNYCPHPDGDRWGR